MIGKNEKWNLELEVSEGFTIDVQDMHGCIVSGDFDSDNIQYLVTERYSPDELYVNGELEKWAEDNGYVLEDQKQELDKPTDRD